MALRARLPSLLLLACLVAACGAACGKGEPPPPAGPPLDKASAPLISRTDSRTPPDAFADAAFATQARGFVAALALEEAVLQDGMGRPYLEADPLYLDHAVEAGVELCRDERFALEPAAAFCSATLIAPDLVLTAGHCVLDQGECAETAVVFGFEASSSSVVQPLQASDVYGCAELIVGTTGDGEEADYAVLRLDRPVTGRVPARVARDRRSLPRGTPITVAGHPIGLPLKITDDGAVGALPLGYAGQEPEYFGADIDTFPGNSGSGAFFAGPMASSAAPRALVGILSASLTRARYRYDSLRDCDRYERWPSVTIWLTYAHQALTALCDELPEGSYPELCACGDGSCDAAREDGALCASDCGDACGDGLCLGAETQASCGQDCTTCGDGSCGAGEDCCADCGCPGGFSCSGGTCAPEIAPGANEGWSCAAPIELPTMSDELMGTTRSGLRRHVCEEAGAESCYGADRHYAFTLLAPASLTAVASGFPHIALALRAEQCADDLPFELAIDRAGAGTARFERVLPAGRYQLTVDGEGRYDDGDYQLELDWSSPPIRTGDICQEAIELMPSGSYIVQGDTSLASNDEADGSAGSCGATNYGNDRFYRFTLTEKTRVTAELDASHDAVISLAAGSCATGTALRCAFGPAQLSRVLSPGTYTLTVDGERHFDNGPYSLALDFLLSPPDTGETCEDALPLVPTGEQHISGTVLGAGDDADTPCDEGSSGDRVYTFTLSEPRTVRIEATGDADVRLDVGAGCASTLGLACTALSPTPSSSNETLDPGTHYLVIDARTPGVGAYDIALDFDSEPTGASCRDAIPLALTSTPATMTQSGVALGSVVATHYRVVLSEPSRLQLVAGDPAALQLSDGSRLLTRPTGELDMNTAAGSYCVQVSRPFGVNTLQLTASAEPLATPDGRGCEDAIALPIVREQDVTGYAALGGSNPLHCSTDAHHFYAFQLAERTSLSATVSDNFVLGLYDDASCTTAPSCSMADDRSIDADLPAGAYRLFVAGYSFAPYELNVRFDCDGCPDGLDASFPDPPDAMVEPDGAAPPIDAGGPHEDAAIEPPPDDAAVSAPDATIGAGGSVAPVPDARVPEPDPVDAGDSGQSDAGDASVSTPSRGGCDCHVASSRAPAARAWLGLALLIATIFVRVRRRGQLGLMRGSRP